MLKLPGFLKKIPRRIRKTNQPAEDSLAGHRLAGHHTVESVQKIDEPPEEGFSSVRRGFLKKLGLGAAGAAVVSSLAAVGGEKARQGSEFAREELEKLQKKFDKLDRRTKILVRVAIIFLGLDLLELVGFASLMPLGGVESGVVAGISNVAGAGI